MTWLQVWFWLTIVSAGIVGVMLWRAPLLDNDPRSHLFTEGDLADACWLCGCSVDAHSVMLHQASVRVVDDE